MDSILKNIYINLLNKPNENRKVMDYDNNMAKIKGLANRDESTPEYKRMFRKNPLLVTQFTRALVLKGEFDAAVQELLIIARTNKKFFLPHYFLSVLYQIMKKKDQAKKHADLAIKLAPKEGCCYSSRGYLNIFMRHKNQDALKDFEKAIKLGEKDGFTYAGRAEAKMRIRKPGMIELALKDFEIAKKLGDKNAKEFLEMYHKNHKRRAKILKLKK